MNKTNGVKSSIMRILMGGLQVFFAANYMPLFMYLTNAEEVYFADILPVLLVFGIIACIFYAAVLIFTKSVWKSAFIVMLGAFLVTNYKYIEKVFFLIPLHIRYWHIVAIIVFLMIHLGYFVIRFSADEFIKTIDQICLFVMVGLLTINVLQAVPAIVEKAAVANRKQSMEENAGSYIDENTLPNIYYFIFDEFSSKATIQKCYNYSNDHFFQTLEKMGFTVSYDSKNMSYRTVTVTTNYMNYDYVVTDKDSAELSKDLKANNATKKLMQQYGYALRFLGGGEAISDWGIADNLIESDDKKSGATTEGGQTIQELIIENTIAYPMVDMRKNGTVRFQNINAVFSYFERKDNYKAADKTYTLTYVESPHVPFVFNSDGTLNNPKNYLNWEDPQYYLHQYQYISDRILDVVKNIIANDPTAVIILQSDHSARGMASATADDKRSILNAVYFMGNPIEEIKGKSGVNTLRTVYSKLFGIELNDVEVRE